MQQQIQTRLEVLKKEFETGQAKLRELEMQQSHLRETLPPNSPASAKADALNEGHATTIR